MTHTLELHGSATRLGRPANSHHSEHTSRFEPSDRAAWGDDANGCTEEQTQPARKMRARSLQLAPTAPRVVAHRKRNHVIVRYRLAADSRAYELLTSVDPAGRRYSPLTRQTRVRHRNGTIVQRVGAGHGPFRVLASAVARDGGRSRVVAVRV